VVAEALVPEFRFATGRFPVTPVVSGRPVALVRVPEVGVPKTALVSVGVFSVAVAIVGEVSKTNLPVPVAPVLVTPSTVG